jgi:NADH-quinone oxidoreductase subunit E
MNSKQVSKPVPEFDEVEAIIERFSNDKSALTAILREIENLCGYIPIRALRQVAKKLEIPLTQVYAVARFYDAFHLTPKGKHIVRVCLGTACYLRGSGRVLEAVESETGVRDGETTPNGKFTIQSVRCLGACALAPVMVLDEKYFDKMTPTKARTILKMPWQERDRK